MKTPSALDIAHLYIVENSLQLVKIGIVNQDGELIYVLHISGQNREALLVNEPGLSLHPQGQITPEIQAIIKASVKAEFAMLYDALESAAVMAEKNIAAKLVRNNGLPTEFVEFMQAHVIMGAEYNTRAAFHAFKRFSRQHGGMKQRSFTRWLVRFADSNDLPFMSRRSNGRSFFTVGGAK